MDARTRNALRRMKSHRRRARWRVTSRLERMLRAMAAQLGRIESRGSPEQWQQAFNDILNIYNYAGQTAEVVKIHAEQIQALSEAYQRVSVLVHNHREVMDLLSAMDLTLSSFTEVVRDQVRVSRDIARAVGADLTPRERRRIDRDARPEETHDG